MVCPGRGEKMKRLVVWSACSLRVFVLKEFDHKPGLAQVFKRHSKKSFRDICNQMLFCFLSKSKQTIGVHAALRVPSLYKLLRKRSLLATWVLYQSGRVEDSVVKWVKS